MQRKVELEVKEQENLIESSRREEFRIATASIEKWIQKWGNPHTTIVIKLDSAEVCQGEIAVPFVVVD